MSEEDFDKKLMRLGSELCDVLGNNLNQIRREIDDLASEIKAERAKLEDKLIKAEARLKIYEAMFEKLNLNINLNPSEKEEE